jgi:alpha-tubulin suppressor-like RCC1 family protein
LVGYKGKLAHEKEWTHADTADEPLPKLVEYFKGKPAKSFISGGIHNMVLARDGGLYSFGCGSDGRLGHPESDKHTYLYREAEPRLIDGVKDGVVVDAKSAYYHNICLVIPKSA